MIIVDASLAAKLILTESDSDTAEDWFLSEADILAAPDLIAVEVTQAVVRRVNAREIATTAARAALHQWRTVLEEGAIELVHATPALVFQAAEIAMRLGHPTADCLYLALAIDQGCDMITCDEKFVAKAQPLFSHVRSFGASLTR